MPGVSPAQASPCCLRRLAGDERWRFTLEIVMIYFFAGDSPETSPEKRCFTLPNS